MLISIDDLIKGKNKSKPTGLYGIVIGLQVDCQPAESINHFNRICLRNVKDAKCNNKPNQKKFSGEIKSLTSINSFQKGLQRSQSFGTLVNQEPPKVHFSPTSDSFWTVSLSCSEIAAIFFLYQLAPLKVGQWRPLLDGGQITKTKKRS